MVKVLIADYSPEVANVLRAHLKADFDRTVKIVAALHEASLDKFWGLIEKNKPEVIVMDIRFFGLGTLRTISEAAGRYAGVKILMVGTYDDHDYLRASMDYGAIDFMYKPIKGAEFKLAMGHIVSVIEDEARQKEEDAQILAEYARDRELFRSRFLHNLLTGVVQDDDEIASSMQYFDLNLQPPYAALSLRIDHFKTVMQGLDERSKHLMIYRIFWHTQQFLGEDKTGYAFIDSFNSIKCLIYGIENQNELLEYLSSLKDFLHKRCGLETTIGLGRIYKELTSLRFSSRQAEAALRYRYLMGYNSIIPIDFVEPKNHITYRYPKRKEENLVYTAVTGEYDYAIKLLREILGDLKTAGDLPPMLLPRIMMNIVISISRYASEIGMEAEGRLREFFNFGDILGIKTISDAQSLMETALQAFCGFVNAQTAENSKRMVMLARSHVDEYFFEDISLDILASQYGTTAEFLGKVFAQRSGMSFREYLMATRINKAKEILSSDDSELTEEEVGAKVGFFDARVFRSVFKRREGMNPMEYRR